MTANDGGEAVALRDDAVSWAPTDTGSIVVLDLRSSRYLNLNAAGSLLWEKVSQGASPGELAAALIAEFGIDDERARQDVAAFLADLRARDLVVDAADAG